MKQILSVILSTLLLAFVGACSAGSTEQVIPTRPSESIAIPSPSPFPQVSPTANWASFMDPEAYEAFIGIVETYFEEHGVSISFGEGYLTIEGDESQQLGLVNLAQGCAQIDPSEWHDFIYAYFDDLLGLVQDEPQVVANIESFDEAEPLLAVRIWPEDYATQAGPDSLFFREDIEGTVSVLVFDFPTSVRSVTLDEFATWGMELEEVFEVALANTLTHYFQDVFHEELESGIELWFLSDGSFFVASQALFLDQYPDCLGEFGSVFGIPTRDILLCHPIDNTEVIEAVDYLILAISGLEFEGPGSVSPYLYWYHEGVITNLPYSLGESEIEFSPPDIFLEVLNQLVAPAE